MVMKVGQEARKIELVGLSRTLTAMLEEVEFFPKGRI